MRRILSVSTHQAIVVLVAVLLTVATTKPFVVQNEGAFHHAIEESGRTSGTAISFVEASTTPSSKRQQHERRMRRRTMARTSDALVTGELPPLSPEQAEVYNNYDVDEEGRMLLQKKGGAKKNLDKNAKRNPLFGPFGKKGKKGFKGFGGGSLFGPGFKKGFFGNSKKQKKFWKKQYKKGGGLGLFNNGYGGGAAYGSNAAYGPNAYNAGYGYNAGYNRPGLNLGAILGPIIGVAVMACIVSKLCCLW